MYLDYSVFDSFLDGVFVVDKNLNLVYCNEVAANLSGNSYRRLKYNYGKSFTKFIKFENEWFSDKKILANVKEATPYLQLRMLTQDGVPNQVLVSIQRVPRELQGPDHWILTVKDQTVEQILHKKYRRQLKLKEESIRALKDLDFSKDRFMILITHELRTPLSAILGTCDILLNKLYDNEQQRDEFTKAIFEQSTYLLEMANNILDYTKIQAGTMEYFIEHLDIQPTVRNCLSAYEMWAKEEKVILEFKVKPGEKSICYFDIERIAHVLRSVIHNAIKFNKKNGRVTVEISKDEPSKSTLVTIADTGVGIAQEEVCKVFDYFEVGESLNNHQSGTGLSMAISKRIIESLGGRILLSSQVGVGTKVKIYIPNEKVLEDEVYRKPPIKSVGQDFAA